jgi:hypothetical protein
MVDKTISSEETELDNVLIEEKPKDFRSLWSRFKKSPNQLVWSALVIYGISIILALPYLFFATHVGLFSFGTCLLAATTMYLMLMSLRKYGFKPKSKLKTLVTGVVVLTTLCFGFRMMNWDRHVLVDYHERTEDFPYPLVTNELASPLIGWTDSFTILMKHEDLKFKGPDFTTLATEVRSKEKEYHVGTIQEFKPFTIYYGSDAQGKTGDIKGKRTDYGWFGSVSTDFVIELEK